MPKSSIGLCLLCPTQVIPFPSQPFLPLFLCPLLPCPLPLLFSLSPGFQIQMCPTLTLSAYPTAAASENPSHPAPHTLPAAFGSTVSLLEPPNAVIENVVTADRPKVRYHLQARGQALPRTSCVTCISHCLSLRLCSL